jgi:quinol monooxygenase YgiN
MIAVKQLLIVGAPMLATPFSRGALSQQTTVCDKSLRSKSIRRSSKTYRAAVREQIEAAIREEPGFVVLYAVSNRDNPIHVTVFEIYKDTAAYKAHLESAHFKKYKALTETMVESLTLVRSTPIMLGATERLSTGAPE